jgi:hypothetical protein
MPIESPWQTQLALALSETVGSTAALLNRFTLDRSQNITAPENFGIFNGIATVGVDYTDAFAISGLWAPPYANSAFSLKGKIAGSAVSTSNYTWYPYKVDRTAQLPGLTVSTSTLLVAQKRAGLIAITLKNTSVASQSPALEVTFVAGTSYCGDDWGFRPPKCSPTPNAESTVLGQSVVLTDLPNALLGTNPTRLTAEITLSPEQSLTYCVAFAIGEPLEVGPLAEEVINDPATFIRLSYYEQLREAKDLYRRVPNFESDSLELQALYNRSVLHLLLHKWQVPQYFKLYPYYGTGSINGGTLGNYLWNFGEGWEILPLYDPVALRAHIKTFLSIDLERWYLFTPVKGVGQGTWYQVNQEKIIGLVYYYVSITGDQSLLSEAVTCDVITKTVIEWMEYHATVRDDLTKPVALVDYGPGGWNHLELPSPRPTTPDFIPVYEGILPDLNGRRYLNYIRADSLRRLVGGQTVDLRARAAALKPLMSTLWDEASAWFQFSIPAAELPPAGLEDLRWTVQILKLIGSPVLDPAVEGALVGHLNDTEFLSDFGLHSLSKIDPRWFPNRPDNGGPGCCTCFPPQIIERLYRAGYPKEAEDVLKRILWWGTAMPYWGDSIYADRMDYRHNTPLQCTLDGIAVAQMIIFGMMGIELKPQGNIAISPHPPSFSVNNNLQGLRLRGTISTFRRPRARSPSAPTATP